MKFLGDEISQRTLAATLRIENSFNSRAFVNTMLGASKLKNLVESQELSKNLFIFRFATKRDMGSVLSNGPRSFDKNLLVLVRVSGEEQPSALNMHFGVFWVRIYEVPLILRSEVMARKLDGILGTFEELDQREAHRNRRFLRIKVTMNHKEPLKRGTMVRFKDKNLRVHFKYERLPTLCFMCGRIGHQMKDCEAVGDLSEEGFEELDEQDLSFGTWLRASPFPRVHEEQIKKESHSSLCRKSLFHISSSHSQCGSKEKGNELEEAEVEQGKKKKEGGSNGNSKG
ncbi:uncharacterized protein LOC131619963 [Vicia villosa]|uniref:uncharacterized protein LOC131619963 n=1 Tax=Vicia villosa TaxID=3911 RepID=UPI00273C9F60|nr:uncharacterized protein LOC131619963 [Vicia villosa]